jgi:hypothetical protein
MPFVPNTNNRYSINEDGEVYDHIKNKVIKSNINGSGYKQIALKYSDGSKKYKYIHRLMSEAYIPNFKNECFIDHIDGNKLNNDITNLRTATQKENTYNRKKTSNNTTSIYKGVNYHYPSKKWRAQIKNNNIYHHIGVFQNEEIAALAYNSKAIELFGEYACLNDIFPFPN